MIGWFQGSGVSPAAGQKKRPVKSKKKLNGIDRPFSDLLICFDLVNL
jgi:hypothetical protein